MTDVAAHCSLPAHVYVGGPTKQLFLPNQRGLKAKKVSNENDFS